MDDFETFKASREKMDPTSRKMSEHQWQQAYAAYRSSRERVSGGGEASSSPKGGKRRRSSKSTGATRGSHRPSSISELGLLRHTVRQQSAYADLRLIIDILAWVAVAMVVLVAVVSLFFYTSVPAALIAILWAGVQVIGIVVARLLVQVLIDLPDIALYRSLQESAHHRQAALDSE
jgi:hypothetical protein